ncbi:hypothetical protein [Halomonas mongoliensis]|uniref:hypothetical protein n=1 Tax=Halomonas mongoliensis TaxID=321265 RepID=UPI00403A93C3
MRKIDPFAQEIRDGAEYRRQRLEEEHERLMRRLKWAMARDDDDACAWLEEQIDRLEEQIDADLAPGRPPNKFDRSWRR